MCPGSTDVVVASYFGSEFENFLGFDVEALFEIGKHLAFHPIDLTEGERPLTDAAPRHVRISVVSDGLGGDYKPRD